MKGVMVLCCVRAAPLELAREDTLLGDGLVLATSVVGGVLLLIRAVVHDMIMTCACDSLLDRLLLLLLLLMLLLL